VASSGETVGDLTGIHVPAVSAEPPSAPNDPGAPGQSGEAQGAGTGLPRTARLLNKVQFQQVFDDPRKSIDPYFTVLARRNAGPQARLGLAIAKKCARRAVDRNRLKRLVRESFRTERQGLPGLDLVVMCRRDAVAADNAQLVVSLAKHWARIRKQLCASSSLA
jgi:ribonuclease P protein component